MHGCTIARGAPVISHFLFPDDCYFFFKAAGINECYERILSRYEHISGQIINKEKSTITFSPNTREVNTNEVCEQLGVNVIQTPGKYLGMPMSIGRRKIVTFSFLTEHVEQKLHEWQNPQISKVDKVTLLKIEAQLIPC